MRDVRHYAIVAVTGVAAVTPPDPFSHLLGALLGIALYEALIELVDLTKS